MTEHLESELRIFTQLRGDGLDPYPEKCSPLHIASGYGLKSYVDYLLQAGADAEALDTRERTPVMYAAKNGHLEVFDLLTHYYREEEMDTATLC
ncbi:hypothetical protein BGX38DRAFT_893371 [Terfezia claveryi]|nr:hypothetical protein BGX38DRAFT_893371 [Terfezia claveryi]